MTLDNRTIAKLAIAIVTATELRATGETIGPAVCKVLETLDLIDRAHKVANERLDDQPSQRPPR